MSASGLAALDATSTGTAAFLGLLSVVFTALLLLPDPLSPDAPPPCRSAPTRDTTTASADSPGRAQSRAGARSPAIRRIHPACSSARWGGARRTGAGTVPG